ncbi:MAG TPA: glycosyl transferase [Gammaproteobacteria bacterium]|nr:glycosyl transferase [Gammaproteobacteria bacterium]
MATLFWVCLFGAVYSYLLYPLLLLLISRLRKSRNGDQTVATPSEEGAGGYKISIIIAAHNEAARIEQKLEQTLALDYPLAIREIIVASDASDDGTDQIVQQFANRGVILVRSDQRLGKEHAQQLAVQKATGELLIFTDTGTTIESDSLRAATRYFDDPQVGAISSVDRLISKDGSPAGEGLYVKYEMALRRLESRINSLVGLSGSFFAARRSLCLDWDTSIPSDFNTAMNCIKQGYRAVNADDVIGLYPDIENPAKEYPRKRRTVLRGVSALASNRELLNPARYPLVAFQLWSHKIMRWAVPWFQIPLLITNLFIAHVNAFYALILTGHLLLLGAALIGSVVTPRPTNMALKIPAFFMQVNIASAHAVIDYFRGQRMVTWSPSKR